MNTWKLEEKINNNYLINKYLQIYLTCKQIEILKNYNFKYVNQNIFYNSEEKIYTSIENCFSFTNEKKTKILDRMNAQLYNEYIQMDDSQIKKSLKKLINKLIEKE